MVFGESIIMNFVDIMADISRNRKESKYPKLISTIIFKVQKRKLLKVLHKLENSNIILNRDNISEYFVYVDQMGIDLDKLNYIKVINTNKDSLVVVINYANNESLLSVSLYFNNDRDDFDISGDYHKGTNDKTGIHITVKDLKSTYNDPNITEALKLLNHIMLHSIVDFIERYIIEG